MESRSHFSASSNRTSDMQTDVSSAIERKSNFQIDSSTTQTDGKSPMRMKPNRKFPIALKHIRKIVASSAMQMSTNGKAAGSSVIATKPHGKAVVVSGNDADAMGFGEAVGNCEAFESLSFQSEAIYSRGISSSSARSSL